MNKYYFIALLLIMSSCQTNSRPIAEVSLAIYPEAGGSAHFTVLPDFTARGAHISPGDQPFVHQQDGTLSPQVVAKIFALALEVLEQKLESNPVKDKDTVEMVSIVDENGDSYFYQKRGAQSAANVKLQELIELLKENSIGW